MSFVPKRRSGPELIDLPPETYNGFEYAESLADIRLVNRFLGDNRAMIRSFSSLASGLAVSLIEESPAAVRSDARVEHVYARALVDQGRNQDALAAEQRVLTACAPTSFVPGGCDAWLVASATRRANILSALVDMGVEDARSEPERSALAYAAATREARVRIQ